MAENLLDKAGHSFPVFVALIWRHLGLPMPTPVQIRMSQYLQQGPRRRGIQGYRGVGKSWLTATYVLWRLWRNPDEHILVVSASKPRADQFATFVQRLIVDVPFLKHLKPESREGKRWSMLAFDVGGARPSQAPSVMSAGITSQITGMRASVIIFDDVEVPNNSMTADQRDKLLKRCGEAEAILLPPSKDLPGGGEVIYLGTFQSSESIYVRLIKERGYPFKFFPARYPDPAKVPAYFGMLDETIARELEANPGLAGEPTDALRFSRAELAEREARWGRSEFARQFMLDTSPSDENTHPLKLGDLVVFPVNPLKAPVTIQWAAGSMTQIKDLPEIGLPGDRFYGPMYHDTEIAPYTSKVMSIDPSGRGKDETSYAVALELSGNVYIPADGVGGYRGGYTDSTLQNLVVTARNYRVNEIVVEDNYGGGMFTQLLRPWCERLYPVLITETHSTGQKERRVISTLEPVMNQHRLVVDPGLIQGDVRPLLEDIENETSIYYSLFYQMTRLTSDRGCLAQDDRIEALSIAVGHLSEALAQDENRAALRHKDRLLEESLDEFLHAGIMAFPGGRRPAPQRHRSRYRIWS